MKRTMVYFLIIFWMCSIASSNFLASEGTFNTLSECKEKEPSKCSSNDVMFSRNRKYFTYIRASGCLVVIKKFTNQRVWNSCRKGQIKNSGCSPRALTLLPTGQVTITDCQKKVLWQTPVPKMQNSPYKLILSGKGKLFIVNKFGLPVWGSHGRKRLRKILFIDEGIATFPNDPKMAGGQGLRTQTVQVKFKRPFKEVPKVAIALRYIDVIQRFNNRINVSVENVTKEGFTAKLTTWADTNIWSVTASWIAHKRSFSKVKKTVIIDGGAAGMPGADGYRPDGQHGKMVNGPNEQSSYLQINFNKKFRKIPRVFVALTMWDFDRAANQRIQINPLEVTKKGFKLQFFKWADTKLYGAGANWLAFSGKRYHSRKPKLPGLQRSGQRHRFHSRMRKFAGVQPPVEKNRYHSRKPKSPRVQSGTAAMPQQASMHNGNGERHAVTPVKFNRPFFAPPMVVVGLKVVDQGSNANQRINISAKDITKDGFNLDVVTWADTQIYGTEVTWIAVANVK